MRKIGRVGAEVLLETKRERVAGRNWRGVRNSRPARTLIGNIRRRTVATRWAVSLSTNKREGPLAVGGEYSRDERDVPSIIVHASSTG